MTAAELGELAFAVATEAGALLAAGQGDAEQVGTKSSRHDLVTTMDRASETLIRQRLTAVRPQDAILGEEEGDLGAGTSGVRWIVDPLDGTVNYFYGLPNWAVSIGVEVDGTPAAGAVVAPALGEAYLGVAGAGAWLVSDSRRTPLHVGEVSDLGDALLATGFGYRPERRAAQGVVVASLLPRVRDIRRAGAAALDLCWVARGRVDAYYERGLAPWDAAAGALIAVEAGARVGGLAGRAASGELTIAANPVLFEALEAALAQLHADRDEPPAGNG